MKERELNFIAPEERQEDAWPSSLSNEQRAEIMRLRWRNMSPIERLRKGC